MSSFLSSFNVSSGMHHTLYEKYISTNLLNVYLDSLLHALQIVESSNENPVTILVSSAFDKKGHNDCSDNASTTSSSYDVGNVVSNFVSHNLVHSNLLETFSNSWRVPES
jgi:hypothetical protein